MLKSNVYNIQFRCFYIHYTFISYILNLYKISAHLIVHATLKKEQIKSGRSCTIENQKPTLGGETNTGKGS